MFGLSLSKLLVLIAVLAAVLVLVRWAVRPRGPAPVARRKKAQAGPSTIDLVRNPETGAYEPRETPSDVKRRSEQG